MACIPVPLPLLLIIIIFIILPIYGALTLYVSTLSTLRSSSYEVSLDLYNQPRKGGTIIAPIFQMQKQIQRAQSTCSRYPRAQNSNGLVSLCSVLSLPLLCYPQPSVFPYIIQQLHS